MSLSIMEIDDFDKTEKRIRKGNWTDEETEVLCKIWKDYYSDFRTNKRHKRLYKQMSLQMSLHGFTRSFLEIQYKVKNMVSIYNVQKRLPNTKWKFFQEVHRILNSVNNMNETSKTLFSREHHPIVQSAPKDVAICTSLDKLNSSEVGVKPSLGSVHLVKVSNKEKAEYGTDSGECSSDSGLQACTVYSPHEDFNSRTPQCKVQKNFIDNGTLQYEEDLSINSIISNNLLDPEFNFLMSLLPYLKKMTMQQRLKTHIRIQEVIQEIGDFQD